MKIDADALRQILQSYGPKGQGAPANAQRANSTTGAGRGDEISISSQGQELQRMIRAAQQVDEVRADRVQELQTQLRSGSYELNPQLIANAMLGLSGGLNG